ncbi:Ig-like domain repeat protein [Candidatus Bathyarchaeota archaeon]|nr:Ig-like domain repeat protein [Candidatus Bathyarchaeota archaeon]
MRFKCLKPGVLLVSVMLLVLVTPRSFAGNYDLTFSSQVQFGLVSHELHVSIPSSLYEYYQGKNPKLVDDNEYATLVTPDAVKPIANSIRNLTLDSTRSDEEFANAVLSLVHQIPYADCDVMYPVETLVENLGKCDTLSLLAASIMKAGGLDVVLLYFKGVHHINVGVHLPYEPHTTWWWQPATGYELNGTKYWIAECTPAMEWKVGDMPPLLEGEQPWIISLENSEETSPAYVSAKPGGPLNSSSISINISPEISSISSQKRTLTISGSLSPAYPNETISVYFSQDGISYSAGKTLTDNLGNYSYSWNLTSTGTHYIRTSWSGDVNYTGADSDILTVFIGFPNSIIQFETPTFHYIYGRGYIARYELQVRQGVEDFLDIQMSGTGILLTSEFNIMKSGQITVIPMEGYSSEVLQQIVIPRGYQPLRLPYDIEQTTNNQFGFILENSGNNSYSLNVKGLDTYEADKINSASENGTAFVNATSYIKENTWYKLVAKISEDQVNAEVQDTNGTVIERVTTTNNAINVTKLVILLTNNTDRAVAFKNLNVETIDQQVQPAEEEEKAANWVELLAPYVTFIGLIAAIVAIAVAAKKRKRV